MLILMHQQQTAFENVEKEEIAHKCFLLNQKVASPFVYMFDIIFSFAAELKEGLGQFPPRQMPHGQLPPADCPPDNSP